MPELDVAVQKEGFAQPVPPAHFEQLRLRVAVLRSGRRGRDNGQLDLPGLLARSTLL
jgi:hypothetical protein